MAGTGWEPFTGDWSAPPLSRIGDVRLMGEALEGQMRLESRVKGRWLTLEILREWENLFFKKSQSVDEGPSGICADRQLGLGPTHLAILELIVLGLRLIVELRFFSVVACCTKCLNGA